MELIEMQRKALRSPATDGMCAQAVKEEYVNWRREADAVAESYRGWVRAPRATGWLGHAAYLFALDREEHAACAYQRVVEQVDGR